jgi:hypothetical protein
MTHSAASTAIVLTAASTPGRSAPSRELHENINVVVDVQASGAGAVAASKLASGPSGKSKSRTKNTFGGGDKKPDFEAVMGKLGETVGVISAALVAVGPPAAVAATPTGAVILPTGNAAPSTGPAPAPSAGHLVKGLSLPVTALTAQLLVSELSEKDINSIHQLFEVANIDQEQATAGLFGFSIEDLGKLESLADLVDMIVDALLGMQRTGIDFYPALCATFPGLKPLTSKRLENVIINTLNSASMR